MQSDKQSNNTAVGSRQTDGRLKWARNKYEVILAIALVVILLLVLVTVRPGRYRPFKMQDTLVVSPYLTHKLVPEFLNEVQLDKSFDMVFEQDGLNDIISRNGWFNDSGTVTVYKPSIVFRRNKVYLMATMKMAGLPTVVTIIASPEVADGMVVFNMKKVKFGSMPMTAVAKRMVRKAIAKDAGETQKRFWNALLENEPFDPTFTLYDTQIKITNVKTEKRKLTITILPVPGK